MKQEQVGLRLISTWPCIVKASYLLDIPHRFEMLRWIELGGAAVYPFEAAHLADFVRMSHDIEDIVNGVDGRKEIIQDIAEISESAVTGYLRAEVEDLISDSQFLQSLPSHFKPSAVEQQRIPLLLARLREIAGL